MHLQCLRLREPAEDNFLVQIERDWDELFETKQKIFQFGKSQTQDREHMLNCFEDFIIIYLENLHRCSKKSIKRVESFPSNLFS